ncbi:MAG: TRAP transporter substrate-binding protein DctP [Pseudomonadota bacterium]
MMKAKLLCAVAFCAGAAAAQVAAEDRADASMAYAWLDGTLESYGDFEVTYDGPPIEIRFSSHLPEVSGLAKFQTQANEILELMSNGKIVTTEAWSGTVHSIKEGREAVRTGLSDVSPCFTLFYPRDYKMVSGLELPFIFESTTGAVLSVQQIYPDYLKSEFERYGVSLLRVAMNGPFNLYTREPVRTMEDLEGLRFPTAASPQILELLGATLVSGTAAEIYTSLQSGTTDGLHFADIAAPIFRLGELVKYRTVNSFNTNPLQYCINPDTYASLPPDLQDVLDRWAYQVTVVEAIIEYDIAGPKAVQFMTEQYEMESITLSEAEMERWRDRISVLEENWVAEREADGLPAKQMLADLRASVAKYEQMTPNELLMDAIENPIRGIRTAD